MKLDVASIWTSSVQQQNFRALLLAMSRPGKVVPLQFEKNAPQQALHAVLATLLDAAVSLADPGQLLDVSLWPLLQARNADSGCADFIVCRGDQEPGINPKLGTLSDPQRSATLVIQVASLTQGATVFSLQGPGVQDRANCTVAGLHPQWLSSREHWVGLFPLGVDCFLVSSSCVMAIPRSSQLEVM